MKNRVFVAAYKDISEWGARSASLLHVLDKYDTVFLLKTDEVLNNAKEKLIQDMKDKTKVCIKETNSDLLVQTGYELLRDFLNKEKEAKEYKVYIIGKSLFEIFDTNGSDLGKMCHSIFQHKNFQVKNVKPVSTVNTNEETLLQMDLFSAINSEIIPPVHSVSDKNKENSATNDKAKEKNIHHTKAFKKPTVHATPFNNKKALENEIFENDIKFKTYTEEYTALQDAKAQLSALLQMRIQEHVSKLLFNQRETITLETKQFYNFILIMLKTENEKAFNESWKASESSPVIELKPSDFQKLKGEITYFEKMSEYMYGEDKWDY